jgi:hypothetical protein
MLSLSANGTLIGLRTKQQQPFRMRQVTAFRMKNLQTRKVPDAIG